MVLSLVLESEGSSFINEVIPVDRIVSDGNRLFLEHQVRMGSYQTLHLQL